MSKSETVNGFRIIQKVSELKRGDYSRISAYGGDQGVHTGSNSPTIGRGNQPFGNIARLERQTKLTEFFK